MSTTFIVGCARSGTTSLLQALALSEQAVCAIEPMPNLNLESRARFDGVLFDPYEPLVRQVAPRVARALHRARCYVEKQVSLVPFMRELVRLLNCRFVIPVRDGRDVVASLINWHNQMFPLIYQECREPGELSERARQVLARQVGADPYDQSLPRPPRDDPWHEAWSTFSRFEMAAWYWAYVNRYLLERIKELAPSRCLMIDYTRPSPETLRQVYDFVGLSDFNEGAVAELLARRVNSLEDRAGESGRFPRWPEWTPAQCQRFNDLAFDTMRRLGYTESVTRPKPPGFGDWWIQEKNDPAWYAEIYEYRRPMHELFKDWFGRIDAEAGPIRSVVEVGCGVGHGYLDFFGKHEYTGFDLSPAVIDHCRRTNTNPRHSFHCVDLIETQPDCTADLVFSQATIDNVYDLDAYLRGMARMARRLLYVTNYRGYFQGITEHRYLWDPSTRVCFNDLSPARLEAVLREEGFQTIQIFPQATQRADIATETVILASREAMDPTVLMGPHEVRLSFKDYRVQPSDWPLEDVWNLVNEVSYSYSKPEMDLANDLDYFRQILATVARHWNLRCGTMEQLASRTRKVNFAIRIDVDIDPVTALKMAQLGRDYHLPLSFYLLHTAYYYGYFQDGVFHRHDKNASCYRALQESGAEVGLHTDPYCLYLQHGIDGAQAVRTELAWLRENGLRICGTSGHNAAPVYGVENFEIFKGRTIRPGACFRRNFTYLPLGVLDEAELGLTYEANMAGASTGDFDHPYVAALAPGDFLRNREWVRQYLLNNPYCRWGQQYRVWLIGRDSWAIAGHDREGGEVFHFGVPWSVVDAFLGSLGSDETTVMTLHAIYLGWRAHAGAEPGVLPVSAPTVVAETDEPPVLPFPEPEERPPSLAKRAVAKLYRMLPFRMVRPEGREAEPMEDVA